MSSADVPWPRAGGGISWRCKGAGKIGVVGFAQGEPDLRKRTFRGASQQNDGIGHREDLLPLTAQVNVPRDVGNVNVRVHRI